MLNATFFAERYPQSFLPLHILGTLAAVWQVIADSSPDGLFYEEARYELAKVRTMDIGNCFDDNKRPIFKADMWA